MVNLLILFFETLHGSVGACFVRILPNIELAFFSFPNEHSTWSMRKIVLALSTKSKPMPVFMLFPYNKEAYRNAPQFIF